MEEVIKGWFFAKVPWNMVLIGISVSWRKCRVPFPWKQNLGRVHDFGRWNRRRMKWIPRIVCSTKCAISVTSRWLWTNFRKLLQNTARAKQRASKNRNGDYVWVWQTGMKKVRPLVVCSDFVERGASNNNKGIIPLGMPCHTIEDLRARFFRSRQVVNAVRPTKWWKSLPANREKERGLNFGTRCKNAKAVALKI